MTALVDIPFKKVDGGVGTLSDDVGDAILVVNVASQCGLTPQYEALQRLYEERRSDGLTILAFPANDFAGQEPGDDAEIAQFCSTQHSVTFPVMSKISVVGDGAHPLYQALREQVPTADGKAEFRESLRGHGLIPTEDPDVLWNFEKFVVGRDGSVVGRFAPAVTPDDPRLLALIDAEITG
jgi:glutathione peroxidase